MWLVGVRGWRGRGAGNNGGVGTTAADGADEFEGVQRRMGQEMRRLQGELVEQQSSGWRQRVQQTRQRDRAGGTGGQQRVGAAACAESEVSGARFWVFSVFVDRV